MDAPLSLCDVLEEEYDAIHGAPDGAHPRTAPENERLDAVFAHIHAARRTALCISGGGIRSATFALGVLQALARHRLLPRFHYLSTVSGGGYVGSWLSAWIHRHPRGLEGVAEQLAAPPLSKLEPEPAPVRYLRAYSNYLTPQLGLLSADTWSLAAIYLRNLLLNWLVLLPALVAVLALPRLTVAATLATVRPWLLWSLLSVGAVLVVVAVVYIGWHRPSARRPRPGKIDAARPDAGGEPAGDGQGQFLRWCLLPLVVAAAVLTTYWAWRVRMGAVPALRLFVVFGLAAHVAAWLVYATRWRRWQLGELAVVALTGALGGLLAWLAAARLFPHPGTHPLYYACFAVPTFLVLLLLAGTAFVGVGSRFMEDEDREWAARFGAWVLIVALCWAAASALVVLGPLWFAELKAWVASIGGVSAALAVVLGRSSTTSSGQTRPGGLGALPDLAARLATPVFVLALVVLLAWGTDWLFVGLDDWLSPLPAALPGLTAAAGPSAPPHFFHAAILVGTGVPRVLALVVLAATFALLMSFFVDANKFSLHAMYRNRLIRAYLGASRERGERRPDAFTGFDPDDNLAMSALWDPAGARRGLFHVVNCALNLVKGDNLAWQERKAESFTFSPLHCGSHHLSPGYRPASAYAGSRHRKRGVSLGTAVTISGAAANPNMGYHSSPLVTFLMTLFNARLGAWLGNPGPAGSHTWKLPNPSLALRPMVDEALGLTDDRHPYVNLSDGGHFENLALYEMVLRRCHLIVVSDAGCDPEYTFEDLGNAIRKIRVDFGIPIRIEHLTFGPGNGAGVKGLCRAVGTIDYAAVDAGAPAGILVYFKPGLSGDEPADVGAYSQSRRVFPHEPTSDQWFSESQFESYRALGYHVVHDVCGRGVSSPEDLAARIRELAGTAPATVDGLPASAKPPERPGPAVTAGDA